MNDSDDEDCFVSINIDGDKLMLITGRRCTGIKFDEMVGYVYMSVPETELLVHALKAAIARAAETPEIYQ